ncbi:MAG: putative lipid II flippase FtsW [Actinobacteria bacterium]|nr:putative lipid II flippase FtsW [Actinomycetota bacterium]
MEAQLPKVKDLRRSKVSAGKKAKSFRPKGDRRQRIAEWLRDIFQAESIYFYRLAGLTGFLVVFGLVMVLSSSSIDSLVANRDAFYVFSRQSLYAVVGLGVMLFISSLKLKVIQNLVKAAVVLGFALQLSVPFLGITVNGNTNWISIAGFTLQPAEFLKVSLIMYIAWFVSNREHELDDPRRVLLPVLIVGGAALALVMLGRDLGTAIIIALIVFGTLVIAGAPLRPLVQVFIGVAIAGALAAFSSASRMARINAWLNPDAASSDAFNWQYEHGTWALAAGGVFGVGLGNSKMKWSWIPEVENDFIFAVIGEELGLIGALVVIGIFALLVSSLIGIMNRSDSSFGRIAIIGVIVWIVSQSAVNIAVVLGVLPVLGVPLPLISAGGSSLIATLGAIGIVLAIEKDNHRNGSRSNRR